jgi:hypothetical protein
MLVTYQMSSMILTSNSERELYTVLWIRSKNIS